MKGRFEVSMAAKTRFCQELGFCETACYVSSHHCETFKVKRVDPTLCLLTVGSCDVKLKTGPSAVIRARELVLKDLFSHGNKTQYKEEK